MDTQEALAHTHTRASSRAALVLGWRRGRSAIDVDY